MDIVPETQQALVPLAQQAAAGYDLLVIFRLAQQEYGLLASSVREIIRERALTRVPNSAPCINGVINLRGRIVPVFNLHRRLGLEEAGKPGAAKRAILIVEHDGNDAGLLVDEVSDVVKISEREVDHSAQLLELTGMKHYLEGTVTIGERLVTLLRLGALLED